MTKMIFALCLLGSTSAMAYPSASVMKENFATCTTEAPNWYQRFGQYVVGFDIYSAADYCRANPGSSSHATPRAASCSVDGTRLQAGFY
ncbi:MAG: hypothetical protein EOP09_06545, partial [Proteobacteria bacterium]